MLFFRVYLTHQGFAVPTASEHRKIAVGGVDQHPRLPILVYFLLHGEGGAAHGPFKGGGAVCRVDAHKRYKGVIIEVEVVYHYRVFAYLTLDRFLNATGQSEQDSCE